MKTVKQRVLEVIEKQTTATSGEVHAQVKAAASHICRSLNELVTEEHIFKLGRVGRGWEYVINAGRYPAEKKPATDVVR